MSMQAESIFRIYENQIVFWADISHCSWIRLWVVCALGELILPQLQNILCDIVAVDIQFSKYYSRSNTLKQCGDSHSYQKSLGLITDCSNN